MRITIKLCTRNLKDMILNKPSYELSNNKKLKLSKK